MKNNVKSAKPNKHDNLPSLSLRMKGALTQKAMQKIRGGDGEGNSGGDIIIIPKPK